jgi:menaquinone-9 beta-reductase
MLPMLSAYDVVVIGAGPAGGAAAYHAAASGLSTLLVERKRLPRNKVCGDGLTPRALRALHRMGLADLLASQHVQIRGVRLTGREHASVLNYTTEPPPFNFGVVVPRILLDNQIQRAAQGVGAELASDTKATDLHIDAGVVRGVSLEGPSGRRRVEAGITVIADGAAGRLSRYLRSAGAPGPRTTAFAVRQYFDEVMEMQPYFEVYAPLTWHARSLIGYGWIFPVEGTMANVGLGLLSDHKRLDQALVQEVFHAFLSELKAHDPRLKAACPLGPVEGGPLNARMIDPSFTPPGVVLVGDAAGLVNVFTGEGIAYALESGELAATIASLKRHDPEGVTVLYGQRLLAMYPHHWAMRDAPRYYRWLLSLGTDLVCERESVGLLGALRRVALDELTPFGDSSELDADQTVIARRLVHLIRVRAVSLARESDPMLAELVNHLLDDATSVSASTLILAAVFMKPVGLLDTTALDALLAVTLFAVGEDLLDGVGSREAEQGNGADSAHIIVGDCLVTEATAVLVKLPDPVFRLISTAIRDSAHARLAHAIDAPSARALARRYAELASPAVCAAVLASAAAGAFEPERAAREVGPFARWYGSTCRALHDLREHASPDLADYVRACIHQPEPPPVAWSSTLGGLVLRLQQTALEILGEIDTAGREVG